MLRPTLSQTISRIRRPAMAALALYLSLVGLLIYVRPVQAEDLMVTFTGNSSAVVGTMWSGSFSASGGTGPYACSISGAIPPGVTFNSSTCILSGTPTAYGNYGVTVTFTDSSTPPASASTSLSLNVEAETIINNIILRSASPNGEGAYTAGYAVWVRANVDYNSSHLAGQQPTGTINISSGTDGPSCSSTLDANGAGECALIFPAGGEKTIRVDYPGSGYARASTGSQEITVGSFFSVPTLSAGRYHTCSLDSGGMMNCWGRAEKFPADDQGNPIQQGPFSKISAGSHQTCGLKTDGTIACWGDNTAVTDQIPAGKFVDISSGHDRVCAIDTNNLLHCWGYPIENAENMPNTKITAVSTGNSYDCAIQKEDNFPVCWGSTVSAPSAPVKALAVGNTNACAIKTDGTLTCWGSPAMTPPTGNNYVTISSGSNYSCAQKTNGTLACWGTGAPVVDTSAAFHSFNSGFSHTCALLPYSGTYTLSCWGGNADGNAPRISLSPGSIPEFLIRNRPFEQIFTGSGGNAPYTFSVTGGSLPNGLVLTNGTLSGTPGTPGAYSFTLSAAETFPGASGLPLRLTPGRQSYTTTVFNPATTTSLSLSASTVNAGSSVTVTVNVSKIPTLPALSGTVEVSSSDPSAGCSAEVVNGVAQCALYFSVAGVQTVTAEYEGDLYFDPSTSPNRQITVEPIVIYPAVGAGNQFSCSINSSGALTCWGENDIGQSSPPSSGVYDQLDLGLAHACALGLNRQPKCWGWDGYGINTPPALNGVTRVTTGNEHSCALTAAGVITCWGNSLLNRLAVPNLGTGNKYTDVDAGAHHTCAVTNTGAARCWGVNTNGQTSAPSGSFSRVSGGGNFTCGLKSDGSVTCWGGLTLSETGPYLSISAGGNFACGLKPDGSVTCWGGLTSAPAGEFSVIAAGANHVCGIMENGGMQCWGDNSKKQAPVIAIAPESLPTIDVNVPWSTQISAYGGRPAAQYTYSLLSGQVLPQGLNLLSTGAVTGTPTQAGNFNFTILAREANFDPSIATTKSYSLTVRGLADAKIDSALPADAMVGRPIRVAFSVQAQAGYSMSAAPTGMVEVNAEGNHCEVPLVNGEGICTMLFASPGKKPITIAYAGDSLYQPAQTATPFEYNVAPFSQNPKLYTSRDRTLVHHANGTTGCIGNNCDMSQLTGMFTRLGIGDDYICGLRSNGAIDCNATGTAPLLNFANGPYIDLSVGDNHVCALKINGQAECQGSNTGGKASAPTGAFTSLSAGGVHTCALNASGEAACWGAITGTPAGIFTQLVSGDAHTCGLRSDGTVDCWGEESAGQCDVPSSPSSYTQIAAGGAQSCGLDADGKVTCWGENTYGQNGPVYGRFIAAATDDNHVCALREGLKITCWGKDDHGEAPQYSGFIPLPDTTLRALLPYQHIFFDAGNSGVNRPMAGQVVEGQLPPGLDTAPLSAAGLETKSGYIIQDFSPAGMILFGTPNVPGYYPFVLRWTDASTYPLVMEQPYAMTITGCDLALELAPLSPADALEGMEYRFNAKVTNNTTLAVPDVFLTVETPAGLTNISSNNPACTLSGSTLTCALGMINPSQTINVLVMGDVEPRSDPVLEFSGNVEVDNTDWPEMDDSDNSDFFSVPVVKKALILSEDYDHPTGPWVGGTVETAPNGQTFLSVPGNDVLNLLLSDLPAHKGVQISFDLFTIGNWQGSSDSSGNPNRWSLQADARLLQDTTFSNDADFLQAYPGRWPTSYFAARSGAAEINVLGFEDSATPVPDARYRLSFKFAHTASALELIFSSQNLPTGAWWGIDNVTIELDNGQTQIFLPLVFSLK